MNDAAAKYWWAAIARHQLLVQHCAGCDRYQHPPASTCRGCHAGARLEWQEHDGLAPVVSYTEVHSSTYPGFTVPYWLATLRIAEEAYLVSNLVDLRGRPHAGLLTRVRFIERGGRTIPVFAPVET
ncbi:Zn-ribbon domain-containing OB-fold protein [Dactylosporangium sp. CA-233914]|uniref:Zn-ribbon domain-containing OB-fold protein n=1 Tax=Dactylosporangium sp. CA-233914 TaxID=3239934 RepID=UPI003D8D60A0